MDRRVRFALRDASDLFQNLEMDRALETLRDAVRRCGRRNCSPNVLAQVHVLTGVVQLAGQSNADAAARSFTTALGIDPEVSVDPTIATPEIMQLFARTRRAALRRGADAEQLLHVAFPEQLTRYPLPVYFERPGGDPPERAEVVYRMIARPAAGSTDPAPMDAWHTLALEAVGQGWGANIPCEAVTGERVEYFIVAYRGTVPYAESGNEDQPYSVRVVSERTQPSPALPGKMPPERCEDPNRPHVEHEGCTENKECAEGLVCTNQLCEKPRPKPEEQHELVSFDLGAGAGFSPLWGEPAYDEAVRINPMDPNSPTSCAPLSCPAMPSGVSTMFQLQLGARFHFLKRFAAGAAIRIQPDAGPRTVLAPVVLMARGYVAFTPRGFVKGGPVGAAFVGLGIGQIQPRPPTPSAALPNASTGHVISGLGNIHFGARFSWGFGMFHLGSELTFNIMVPRTVFTIDLNLFAGMQF